MDGVHRLRLRPRHGPVPTSGDRRPPQPWRRYTPLDVQRRRQYALVAEEVLRAAELGDDLTLGAWQELERLLQTLVTP